MKPLAFTGKVIETSPIDGADFIHSVSGNRTFNKND